MKICKLCKTELTAENTTPGVIKNRIYYCKFCWAVRNKQHRETHPKNAIFQRIRNTAKQRGMEFNLQIEDIPDIPKRCPVFPWIVLVYRVGVERGFDSPSLDRIDNSKGYIKGNIRWISFRANSLKSDATGPEMIALGKDARKWSANY